LIYDTFRTFSQPLDQVVEGWNKHFGRYHSGDLSDLRFEMSWSPRVENSRGSLI